jgi:hypothetical protein
MPKPVLPLALACLAASCIADAPADPPAEGAPELQPDGVHWGKAPDLPPKPADGPSDVDYGIPPGPCRTACRLVMWEGCGSWEDDCAGADPSAEYVTCGPTYLTCGAARQALLCTPAGQMYCYRNCMSLN